MTSRCVERGRTMWSDGSRTERVATRMETHLLTVRRNLVAFARHDQEVGRGRLRFVSSSCVAAFTVECRFEAPGLLALGRAQGWGAIRELHGFSRPARGHPSKEHHC